MAPTEPRKPLENSLLCNRYNFIQPHALSSPIPGIEFCPWLEPNLACAAPDFVAVPAPNNWRRPMDTHQVLLWLFIIVIEACTVFWKLPLERTRQTDHSAMFSILYLQRRCSNIFQKISSIKCAQIKLAIQRNVKALNPRFKCRNQELKYQISKIE